jgi:polyphosphate kinase
VRTGLIERIERETAAALAGHEAWVKIKVNSAVDEAVIDSLYRASQAGVRVDLLVRGICSVRPGVKGLSENIRVRSILGRFLEHSRIYAFRNAVGPAIGEGADEGPEVFIGSADLMHRNLDRRVEALIRMTDPEHITSLLTLMEESMADTTASWWLGPDDVWTRHRHAITDDGEDRGPLVDLQAELIARQRRTKAGR